MDISLFSIIVIIIKVRKLDWANLCVLQRIFVEPRQVGSDNCRIREIRNGIAAVPGNLRMPVGLGKAPDSALIVDPTIRNLR